MRVVFELIGKTGCRYKWRSTKSSRYHTGVARGKQTAHRQPVVSRRTTNRHAGENDRRRIISPAKRPRQDRRTRALQKIVEISTHPTRRPRGGKVSSRGCKIDMSHQTYIPRHRQDRASARKESHTLGPIELHGSQFSVLHGCRTMEDHELSDACHRSLRSKSRSPQGRPCYQDLGLAILPAQHTRPG